MKYNIKELIYKDEEKPVQEKVNINIPIINELILSTPKDIINIISTPFNTRVTLLNTIISKMNTELNTLSNSDNLNAVSKIINKKNLPEIKISGYNYTNLDKVMIFKNPYIKIIDNFDEILGEINKITNMSISDEEKKYKLSQINIETIYKKSDDNLTDFGFKKHDKIPQYYRDNSDNIIDIEISDYESIYKNLKSCKRYSSIFTGYIKIINTYTITINKIINGKEIYDIYNKYNPDTPIGKEITRILIEEGKVLNQFSDLFTMLITTQINEVKDSLKQDINIINNLVKEYRK